MATAGAAAGSAGFFMKANVAPISSEDCSSKCREVVEMELGRICGDIGKGLGAGNSEVGDAKDSRFWVVWERASGALMLRCNLGFSFVVREALCSSSSSSTNCTASSGVNTSHNPSLARINKLSS